MADTPKIGSISLKKDLLINSKGNAKEIRGASNNDAEQNTEEETSRPGGSGANADEDEDDVPPGFFDDMMDKDFLASLDVVDTWEDGEARAPPGDKLNSSKTKGRRENAAARRRRSSSRGRARNRGTRRSRSNENRRDPGKTKRDIQRDKDKCAKDKEAKFISEKLRVVETGLVPPGMEMEFEPTASTTRKSPEPRKRNKSVSPSAPKRRRISPPVRKRYSPPLRRSPLRRPSPPPRRNYTRQPTPERRRRRSPDERRGRSPTRNRNSFLDELDEKLKMGAEESKLRDIQRKINGLPTASGALNKYPPVPSNNLTYPPQQVVYDQQYFIGNQEMPGTSFAQPLQPLMQVNVGYDPIMQPQPYYNQPQQVRACSNMMDDHTIQKLFNDDNVNLTRFLNFAAGAIDKSKPLDIKDKIKVITRCQDGIKLMSEYAKPTGRFYYKKSNKAAEKPPECKYQSPLKKIPPVRYHFTTKAIKVADEKCTTPIGKLLLKLGLSDEPIASTDTAPDTSKHGQSIAAKVVQTDPIQCPECESRRAIKKKDFGTQCGPPTVDFGCQVSEDDFLTTARSALKNILKNQSLATLTPAQILMSESRSDNEIFPAARRMVEHQSPERSFARMDYPSSRVSSSFEQERRPMNTYGGAPQPVPAPPVRGSSFNNNMQQQQQQQRFSGNNNPGYNQSGNYNPNPNRPMVNPNWPPQQNMGMGQGGMGPGGMGPGGMGPGGMGQGPPTRYTQQRRY